MCREIILTVRVKPTDDPRKLMRPLFSMENSIVLFQESVEYKHG
jgi:hypothetical protein